MKQVLARRDDKWTEYVI